MISKFVVLLLLGSTLVAAGVPRDLNTSDSYEYGIFESIGGFLSNIQGKLSEGLDSGKQALSSFLDNFKDKREKLAEAAKKKLSELLEKYEQIKVKVQDFDKSKDSVVALIQEWRAKGEQLIKMSKEQIAELREKINFILQKQQGTPVVDQISKELDKIELAESLEDLEQVVDDSIQGNVNALQLRSAFTDKVGEMSSRLYEKVLDLVKNGSTAVSDLISKIKVQRVKAVEFAKEKLAVLKREYERIEAKLEEFVGGKDGILPLITKFIENTKNFVQESRQLVQELKEKIQLALQSPEHAQHAEEVKDVVEDVKELQQLEDQLENAVEEYKTQLVNRKIGNNNYRQRILFWDLGSILQKCHNNFVELHKKLLNGKDLNSIFQELLQEQEKWFSESDKRFAQAIKQLLEALQKHQQQKEKPQVVEEPKEVEEPKVVEEVKEPEPVEEVKEPEVAEEVREPELVEEVKEPEVVEEVKEHKEEGPIKVNELPDEVKEVLQIEDEVPKQQESAEKNLE